MLLDSEGPLDVGRGNSRAGVDTRPPHIQRLTHPGDVTHPRCQTSIDLDQKWIDFDRQPVAL
jgi:hypothetical protein